MIPTVAQIFNHCVSVCGCGGCCTSKACTGMALLWRVEKRGRDNGEDKLMSCRAFRAWGWRVRRKGEVKWEKKTIKRAAETKTSIKTQTYEKKKCKGMIRHNVSAAGCRVSHFLRSYLAAAEKVEPIPSHGSGHAVLQHCRPFLSQLKPSLWVK